MPRQAITLGCFILNAIWVGMFFAAVELRSVFVLIAGPASLLSFLVAMGYLLYPYRGLVTTFWKWWARNISLSQQPNSLQKFHKRN